MFICWRLFLCLAHIMPSLAPAAPGATDGPASAMPPQALRIPSLRLSIVLLAVVSLLFNALLLAEILLWRSVGDHLILGRYSLKFVLGVLLPSFVLVALNITILARSLSIQRLFERARTLFLIAGVVFAVAAAAGLASRMASPRIALLFLLSVVFEGLGAVLLRLVPQAVVRVALMAGLTLVPLLLLDTALYRRMLRVASLPDYRYPALVFKLASLPRNPGGLLRPGIDCRARGSSVLSMIHWETNSFGFRNNDEITREKPEGMRRILVLGDSFSAGSRLSQSETFPSRLQEILTERGEKVQVLNAETEDPAISAWYLDRHGFSFHPDVVVMAFCIGNDFMETDYRLTYSRTLQWTGTPGASPLRLDIDRAEFESPSYSKLSFPERYTTGHSVARLDLSAAMKNPLWEFPLGRAWLTRRAFRATGPGWAEGAILPGTVDERGRVHPMDVTTGFGFFAKGPIPEVDRAYASTRDVLRWIHAECARRGASLVLVAAPQVFQIYPANWLANCRAYGLRAEEFDLSRPSRWMQETCREIGIALVDPIPAMRAEASRPGAPRLYLFGGDMHWNARGAALVARIVSDSHIPQL